MEILDGTYLKEGGISPTHKLIQKPSKRVKQHIQILVFCPVEGLSKEGCPAEFVYQYSIILAGLLEQLSIMDLNNYFDISGNSRQK